jgi:hypothetical protein
MFKEGDPGGIDGDFAEGDSIRNPVTGGLCADVRPGKKDSDTNPKKRRTEYIHNFSFSILDLFDNQPRTEGSHR